MIMRKKDNVYKQVGFKKVRQPDGTYKDVEYQYSRDSNGEYKLTFEKGFDREVEGELPLTLDGIGKPLKNYIIYGATVQDGEPTPDNPVEVQALGDKTANLFDKDNTEDIVDKCYINQSGEIISNQSGWYMSNLIAVDSGSTYIYRFNTQSDRLWNAPTIAFYDSQGEFMSVATHSPNINYFSFKVPENAPYVRVSVPKNLKHETMLNEGSTALPYEPYGYKIPVETRGKNLFDMPECVATQRNGYYAEFIIDSVVKEKIINEVNAIQGDRTINFKVDNDNFLPSVYITYKETASASDFRNPPFKISSGYTIENIVFRARSNNSEYNGTTVHMQNFQLELGSTATPYEPYVEPITTNIYLDKQLYKISNYADTLCYAEQKVERVVKELVLTGEEIVGYDSDYTRFYLYLPKTVNLGVRKNPVCSTHFVGVFDGQTVSEVPNNAIYSDSTNNRYFIKTLDYTTVDDFKAYLAAQYAVGTPVKVYYVLSKPEIETVELPKIPTIDGTTVIDIETMIKPSFMYTKYKTDNPKPIPSILRLSNLEPLQTADGENLKTRG